MALEKGRRGWNICTVAETHLPEKIEATSNRQMSEHMDEVERAQADIKNRWRSTLDTQLL
jgi:hypothetical protein